MSTETLFLAWLAFVALVMAFAIRPWKTPAARAPLPLVLCTGMALWVLGTGARMQAEFMQQGSWTAATTTIAFVPLKAIFMALLTYWAARTVLEARATPGPRNRWVLPACLSLFTLYLLAVDVRTTVNMAHERHARSATLTPEDVVNLTQRIKAGEAGADEQSAFIGNSLCPPELLAQFAAAPDPQWRRAVARNAAIGAETAAALAQDSDEQVRFMLAFNRKLPPAVLSQLAADSSEMVRETVAWTDDLPEDDFNRLIDDPSPRVRATVALQTRLSKDGLARLLADPEQRVRDAANRWQ